MSNTTIITTDAATAADYADYVAQVEATGAAIVQPTYTTGNAVDVEF